MDISLWKCSYYEKLFTAYYLRGLNFPGTTQPFSIDQMIPTLSQYDIKFDPIYFLTHVFICCERFIGACYSKELYIFIIFDQNKKLLFLWSDFCGPLTSFRPRGLLDNDPVNKMDWQLMLTYKKSKGGECRKSLIFIRCSNGMDREKWTFKTRMWVRVRVNIGKTNKKKHQMHNIVSFSERIKNIKHRNTVLKCTKILKWRV